MSAVFLEASVVLAVRARQIAEHGGAGGLRDASALEAALARPRQRAAYGAPDPCELAACLAFGLARSHPFIDGNKRTAYVACRLFLELNGLTLTAPPARRVLILVALAAGDLDEAGFAAWLRENTAPR